MILTLLDTGIRCSELVQLRFEDMDLEDLRRRILHAKGNKQRVVPFASRCSAALKHYGISSVSNGASYSSKEGSFPPELVVRLAIP